MTGQEKRQLVDAVITQLKNEGTDVSSATVVKDVNGVSYVLCYDTNGNIVRVSPDTINQQESTNKDAIKANATAIANETQRATEAEGSLGIHISRVGETVNKTNTDLTETKKDIANQLFAASTADKVNITGRNEQSMRINFSADIPAATTEKAGVMTAGDKKKVNASIKNIAVNPNVDDVELDLEDNTEKTSHAVFPAATAERAGVMSAEDKKVLENLFEEAVKLDGFEVEELGDGIGINYDGFSGNGGSIEIPFATEKNAGVMSAADKKALDDVPENIAKEKTAIVNGDTIAGLAREIHSRNGKNVTDSFLARSTAGSGTIGDGVASLKSVGGNIVKNIVDGTFESGWIHYISNTSSINKDISTIISQGVGGVEYPVSPVAGHIYYISVMCKVINGRLLFLFGQALVNATNNDWHSISCRNAVQSATGVFIRNNDPNSPALAFVRKPFVIDLTEMFGAGKEPDQATCDRLFGTMDALPQGLSIANPTEFKSTGFNQFNPENVLEGKAIVDNTIVSGDKKIAVIPCLPCKVGTGENNGYCIHGDFGDDIKVYLTPLNPKDVDGELYMHELTKDATTDTYVPLIKGYMLVEVPTTANLCAHFLWSEDKCERNSYEPYFDSKIELPVIPQMSEYGLAGIQSSGTLVADEIDFERGVYVKRIGSVDMGTLNWRYYSNNSMFAVEFLNTYKSGGEVLAEKYTTVKKGFTSSAVADKTIFAAVNAINRIHLKDSTYTEVSSLKASLQGVMLYYELAEPEEYPLPKVDNNYISSDYGVERFDSIVPCNANNLYYMRSLAGETRNFLDRLYDSTDKTDAKEVADYITNGITENNKKAEDAPNLALRALFITVGAEYNNTNENIVKTAPWGEAVQCLPKHYYLNGLGDITERQMMDIYNAPHDGRSAFSYARNTARTYILRGGTQQAAITSLVAWFAQSYLMEVLAPVNFIGLISGSCERMFSGCTNLRHLYLDGFLFLYATSFYSAFTGCSSLITCCIKKVAKDIAFADSSKISKESIIYIIENAAPSSAITITLHPDAYARLAEDADIVAALEAKPLVTLVSA